MPIIQRLDYNNVMAKKPFSKKKIIIISIIGALSLVALGVGGYFLGQWIYINNNTIDYSKLSETELEDDQVALMKKYSESVASDYTKDFKSYELANIGINKIQNHDYVVSKTIGSAKALGVDQSVRAASIKNKNEYFLENLSVSKLVQTAKRFYQKEDVVKTYNGSEIDIEKAAWNENPDSELSLKDHEAKWGKQLSRPLLYIISSKTTLDTSTATKSSDGYTVKLDLSPKYAVLRYERQIVEISPVTNPIFHKIHLTLKLDNQLNLLSYSVDESYSVVMVILVETAVKLEETYTYDVETKIPNLTEDFKY